MNNFAANLPHNQIPSLGLFALALTISTYAFSQIHLLQPPVTSLGTVLLIGGGLQILTGLHSHSEGLNTARTTLVPLGLFWLSLIGFEVFPELGYGRHPSPVAMVAYLSMWGFFVALLFLGSFRQSRPLQLIYATLMVCLLLLAMATLKENPLLLLFGSLAGIICGLTAGCTALAQLYHQWFRRTRLPRGSWQSQLNDKTDETLAP
ncbi:MAG TPA: acetate uptake transporter [Malonomonas sp.]